MSVVNPTDLEAACDIARRAGELTLDDFRDRGLEVEIKGDGSPVTEADRRAERLMRDEISRRFPDDGIIGEEEDPLPGRSGRTWYIDPIDGTQAFAAGVPLYSNLLALVVDDRPVLGVINLPATAEWVAAAEGLGCEHNGVPCRVRPPGELSELAVTSSGWDAFTGTQLAALAGGVARMKGWGDGYGYALVATGRIDAMIDAVAAPYDLAPIPVIIAEAGGRFTDLSGRVGFAGGSGLASAGPRHDELLALLS